MTPTAKAAMPAVPTDAEPSAPTTPTATQLPTTSVIHEDDTATAKVQVGKVFKPTQISHGSFGLTWNATTERKIERLGCVGSAQFGEVCRGWNTQTAVRTAPKGRENRWAAHAGAAALETQCSRVGTDESLDRSLQTLGQPEQTAERKAGLFSPGTLC